ncbi:MAG: hypothetical protein JRE70_05910 [Deltaproteobacteria bacterium]|nr:hypothetical protein [Deltaproteobacteria bacterium]
MAARKKSPASKKKAKKRTSRSAFQRLEDDMPKTLRDYRARVRKNLNQLERDIERAVPQARRRTARLIREASHELGRIEERGAAAWRRRAKKMTLDAQRLLRRLERAVAPPRAKKKVAKKKA